MLNSTSDKDFNKQLRSVAGLERLAKERKFEGADLPLIMELVLHGLTETEVLNRDVINQTISFQDMLAGRLDEDDLFGQN